MVSMDSTTLVCWNVCGLHSGARRALVVDTVVQERTSLLYLQETKMNIIDDSFISSLVGINFGYAYLPAIGTRGAILIDWRLDMWSSSHILRSQYSLRLKLSASASGASWWIIVVYDHEKVLFLDELRGCDLLALSHGCRVGTFNLIYKAADKNNARLNRRLMGKFRRFIQDMELSELHLNGRLYTLSNEQDHPTLCKIDRAFAYVEWCSIFLHHHLHAGSSSGLDHAPLILHTNINCMSKK
jgi:hypothetical protein